MTPKSFGGPSSALLHTREGLTSLGVDSDIIALETTKSSQSTDIDVHVSLPKNYDEIEAALSKYDGLVLSDTDFRASQVLTDVIAKSEKIAMWTSARHWNSTSKINFERHEIAKNSPKWSGAYVSFWPEAEKIFPDVKWHRGILPYKLSEQLQDLPRITSREFDFAFLGRTDPKKGLLTYVSALERAARSICTIDGLFFRALIAGAPMEAPGGPHIAAVSNQLESWGWRVVRAVEKGETGWMRSTWTAHKDGNEIVYSGAYGPQDLPSILGNVKTYVNTTIAKYGCEHLEFTTMEAMDAGCYVIAPNDWPESAYPDKKPRVRPVPEESYRITRGKRVIFTDVSEHAVDTTYAPFGDILVNALKFYASEDVSINRSAEIITEHNREVLSTAHDPAITAQAYLNALEIKDT